MAETKQWCDFKPLFFQEPSNVTATSTMVSFTRVGEGSVLLGMPSTSPLRIFNLFNSIAASSSCGSRMSATLAWICSVCLAQGPDRMGGGKPRWPLSILAAACPLPMLRIPSTAILKKKKNSERHVCMQVDTIKIKLTYHKLQCNIDMQTAVQHKKNRNIILFHWNINGNTGSDNDPVAKQSPLHPYWRETISMCAINNFFWKEILNIHIRIHSGDRPYQCNVLR